jgi:hypothetical protein
MRPQLAHGRSCQDTRRILAKGVAESAADLWTERVFCVADGMEACGTGGSKQGRKTTLFLPLVCEGIRTLLFSHRPFPADALSETVVSSTAICEIAPDEPTRSSDDSLIAPELLTLSGLSCPFLSFAANLHSLAR